MSLPRFMTSRLHVRALLPLLVVASASVPVRTVTVADEIKPQQTLEGHNFEVYSVAFSPDGKTLASGGGHLSADLKPGEIFLWDVGTGKVRHSVKGHGGGVRPDSNRDAPGAREP